MTIASVIIFTIIGIFTNRIRGGGLIGSKMGPWCDEFNAVVFGLALFFVMDVSLWIALLAIPAMWLGENPGWGSYIVAIRDEEYEYKPEIKLIDRIIAPLQHQNGLLWGAAGLTLRGILWAFPIALVFQSPIPIAGGMLMGLCYVIAKEGNPENIYGEREPKKMWALGEYIFGGVFWFMCALGAIT